MSNSTQGSTPPGLYDRSDAEPKFDVSPGEWIAVALTIVWLALCAIFFFGMETANDGDGLRIVIEVLAVFMPIGMMWVGATVTVVDEDTDAEKTWQIVGEYEADIEKGLLNIKSPIARALIGKEEGDSVEVRTPGGEKSYEVLKISYV